MILNETNKPKELLSFDYDAIYDILYVYFLDKKGNPSYGEETNYGLRYRDMITDEVIGYKIDWFKSKLNSWEDRILFNV